MSRKFPRSTWPGTARRPGPSLTGTPAGPTCRSPTGASGTRPTCAAGSGAWPSPGSWSARSSAALRTCELAGFAAGAEVLPDLTEWDYRAYEGRGTAEVRVERPGWYLFREGCPGGESVADVGGADRVIAGLREAGATPCCSGTATSSASWRRAGSGCPPAMRATC